MRRDGDRGTQLRGTRKLAANASPRKLGLQREQMTVDEKVPIESATTPSVALLVSNLLQNCGTRVFPFFDIIAPAIDEHPALCECPYDPENITALCCHRYDWMTGLELLASPPIDRFPPSVAGKGNVEPFLDAARSALPTSDEYAIFECELAKLHLGNIFNDKVIAEWLISNDDYFVSINLKASSILHLGLGQLASLINIVERGGAKRRQLVIEITECTDLNEEKAEESIATRIRQVFEQLDLTFVCDDQSSRGTSDARLLLLLPDGVKLDQQLIRQHYDFAAHRSHDGGKYEVTTHTPRPASDNALRSVLVNQLICHYARLPLTRNGRKLFVIEGLAAPKLKQIISENFSGTGANYFGIPYARTRICSYAASSACAILRNP